MISYREYLHREYNIIHAPLEPELDFYNSIKNGDMKKIKKLCEEESFIEKEGLGILSKDKLQNMKYHFVISAAMIARSCIDGGLMMSEAYDMSDYYIQTVDAVKSLKEVGTLHSEMCFAYTRRMQKLHRETIYSKPVLESLEYIYEHLNTKITVEDLCNVTNLSKAYLSRLFKKEIGETIKNYIQKKKIETAKSMLEYTDYSISEISAALAFPSQSHFTKVFKDECKITPGKYSRG